MLTFSEMPGEARVSAVVSLTHCICACIVVLLYPLCSTRFSLAHVLQDCKQRCLKFQQLLPDCQYRWMTPFQAV